MQYSITITADHEQIKMIADVAAVLENGTDFTCEVISSLTEVLQQIHHAGSQRDDEESLRQNATLFFGIDSHAPEEWEHLFLIVKHAEIAYKKTKDYCIKNNLYQMGK